MRIAGAGASPRWTWPPTLKPAVRNAPTMSTARLSAASRVPNPATSISPPTSSRAPIAYTIRLEAGSP